MCKFCDNLTKTNLMHYDNRYAMGVSYGQYSGVNVQSNLYINGNMLILDGNGSYRSRSDCYYDAEGLDIENEMAHDSKANYIKIKYCPFCGKEIKSVLYEKTKTNDEIIELKTKLKELKRDLNYSNMFINFEWSLNKRTPEEIDKLVEEHRKEVEAQGWKFTHIESYVESIQYYGYIEKYYEHPLTLKELKEKFTDVKGDIIYGDVREECKYGDLPDKFTLDTKIRSYSYFRPTYYSHTYILTDKMYEKLAELGYIQKDDSKYNDMIKNREKIKKEIEKVNNKLNELKEYLNSLNEAA